MNDLTQYHEISGALFDMIFLTCSFMPDVHFGIYSRDRIPSFSQVYDKLGGEVSGQKGRGNIR